MKSGAPLSGTGSRPTDQAPTGLAAPRVDPSRAAFNVNNYVWVHLTDVGREYNRRWHTDRYPTLPYVAPQECADGWSKWQLWSLMQEFGSAIYMGGPVPFATTIHLDASAIDARSDATGTGAAVGESAVPQADAVIQAQGEPS